MPIPDHAGNDDSTAHEHRATRPPGTTGARAACRALAAGPLSAQHGDSVPVGGGRARRAAQELLERRARHHQPPTQPQSPQLAPPHTLVRRRARDAEHLRCLLHRHRPPIHRDLPGPTRTGEHHRCPSYARGTGDGEEEARENLPIGSNDRLTTPEPDPDQRRWSALTISTAPSTRVSTASAVHRSPRPVRPRSAVTERATPARTDLGSRTTGPCHRHRPSRTLEAMTVTLDLPPEAQERLEAEAGRRGITIDQPGAEIAADFADDAPESAPTARLGTSASATPAGVISLGGTGRSERNRPRDWGARSVTSAGPRRHAGS